MQPLLQDKDTPQIATVVIAVANDIERSGWLDPGSRIMLLDGLLRFLSPGKLSVAVREARLGFVKEFLHVEQNARSKKEMLSLL